MKPTLIALLQLVFAHSASALLSTNITRTQGKGKFTNPNRTAVKACLASGMSSSFPDSCVKFDSVNTQAECWNSRDCCKSCQCKEGYPTYLAHLGKCVSLSELNSDVFGHGSIGCESHLEVKTKGSGGGGGDGDDDDADEDDGSKQKDVCKVSTSTWSPPVLDLLQTPSPKDPKIKFCKHKDVESCDLEQARYSGFSQWHNVTNLSHTFWGAKDKKDILFKWSTAASSNLSGSIFVINLKCKQKKKGKPVTNFSACFIFKSDGTQIVTPPSQSTTPAATTTIKMTTLKPKTTVQTTTMASTTKSKTTVMPSTLKSTKMPTTKPSTNQKARETTSLPVTQSTTDVTLTKPIETSERTEPTEPVEPTEPAAPTEPMEPGDTRRRSLENSSDDSRGGTIVIVVSVLSALFAVTVVSVIIVCYLKKRNQGKKAFSSNQFSIQFKKQSTHHSATSQEEHINQDQNDYQPLGNAGKQTDGTKWEPPSYQGLTKKTERAWGEGEVYINPTMYQELTKKETTSNENMPAYHPLMKPSKSADVSAYDYGYMSTNGKDGLAATETTNKENPYYFKLEQPGQMEKTTDKENPYYFKLEQPGQIEEAAGKESPYYFKLEEPEKPN